MDFSSWKNKCCLSCRVKASCFARNSSTWHQTFGSWKLDMQFRLQHFHPCSCSSTGGGRPSSAPHCRSDLTLKPDLQLRLQHFCSSTGGGRPSSSTNRSPEFDLAEAPFPTSASNAFSSSSSFLTSMKA